MQKNFKQMQDKVSQRFKKIQDIINQTESISKCRLPISLRTLDQSKDLVKMNENESSYEYKVQQAVDPSFSFSNNSRNMLMEDKTEKNQIKNRGQIHKMYQKEQQQQMKVMRQHCQDNSTKQEMQILSKGIMSLSEAVKKLTENMSSILQAKNAKKFANNYEIQSSYLNLENKSDEPFSSLLTKTDFPQTRFRLINFNIPDIPSLQISPQKNKGKGCLYNIKKKRKVLIGEWLGCIVQKIFSIGFMGLLRKQMDENQTKIYCSEMIILGLLKMIKKNDLNEEEITYINQECLKNIFQYNFVKYPQTLETQKNKSLSSLVVTKNNMLDPNNDLIIKSGIKFNLKADGDNYNQEIMLFFNYLINLLNSSDSYTDIHHNITEYLDLPSEKDEDSNPKLPLFKRFHMDISAIFNLIENQEKIQSDQDFSTFNMLQKEISSILKRKNTFQKNQNLRKKNEYKDMVKSYTKSGICPKISPNTELFTKTQIQNGDLILKNPAFFRIATKWVEELQKYFQKDKIAKQYQFWMRTESEQYLKQQQHQIFINFLEYYKNSQGGPSEFLKDISRNNFHFQQIFAKNQCPNNLRMYSVEEGVVGKYAYLLQKNSEVYLIKYLNCLIHTLLKACQIFRRYLIVKADGFHENPLLKTDQNFINNINLHYEEIIKQQADAKDAKMDKTPQMITFKLGDILRSKISSGENEIKFLYKKLEQLSKKEQGSQFLKIVRVKNRLQTGNRDILMNLMYRNTLLIQIQLGIKSKTSNYIQASNIFSHFIYELKRAKFGPVTELANIWTHKCPRAQFFAKNQYFKQLEEQENTKIESNSIECTHPFHKQKQLYLPYICSYCKQYFTKMFFKSFQCSLCSNSICYHCRNDCQDDKKAFFREKIRKYDHIEIFYSQKIKKCFENKIKLSLEEMIEILPLTCYIVNMKSAQKNVKQVFKIIYQRSLYYFNINEQKNEVFLVEKISNRQELAQFIIFNIIATKQEQINEEYDKICKKLAQKYFIFNDLSLWTKNQRQSITVVNQNLDEETILKICENNKKWHNLRRLNISESSIKNLNFILHLEPFNLHSLVLNGNKFCTQKKQKNMEEQEVFKNKLKKGDLSKLQYLSLSSSVGIQGILQIFPKIINLKVLKLQACTDIQQLPSNIGDLKLLTQLIIKDCSSLKFLPLSICQLKNLKKINASNCSKIKTIPTDIGNLQMLEQLYLSCLTRVKKLPSSITKLKNLKVLILEKWIKLRKFPKNIDKLVSLVQINLKGCSSLSKIPSKIGKCSELNKFKFWQNPKVKKIPQSFANLTDLQEFSLFYCKLIEKLPKSFIKLKNLKFLSLWSCINISSLPEEIGLLEKINEINLNNCISLKNLPQSIVKITSLKILSMVNCFSLTKLPENFQQLVCLQQICLKLCRRLQRLPQNFSNLFSLKVLDISLCSNLQALPQNFKMLSTLQILNMNGCKGIKRLSYEICQLNRLKKLFVQGFTNFEEEIKGQNNFSSLFGSLQELSLSSPDLLSFFTSLFSKGYIFPLKILNLKSYEFRQIPCELCLIETLKDLKIEETKIKKLPNFIKDINSLKYLRLYYNPELTQIQPQVFESLPKMNLITLIENNFQNIPKKSDFKNLPNKFVIKNCLKLPSPNDICSQCEEILQYPFYWCRWSEKQNDFRCRRCVEKKLSKQEGYYEYKNNSILLLSNKNKFVFDKNVGKNIQPENNAKFFAENQYICNGKNCPNQYRKIGIARYACLCCPMKREQGFFDLCEHCMLANFNEDKEDDSFEHDKDHHFIRILFNVKGYYEI